MSTHGYPRPEQIEFVRTALTDAFGYGIASSPNSIVNEEGLEEDPERQSLFENFAGRDWWTVNYTTLLRYRNAIPLFNESGFSYFIPAFALACLDHSRKEAHDLCGWVLMNLNPVTDEGKRLGVIYERLDKFPPQQKRALAQFVQLFLGVEDLPGNQARASFEVFWQKYV